MFYRDRAGVENICKLFPSVCSIGAEFNLTLFGLDSSLLIPKGQRVLWGLYSLKRFHISFGQKLLSRASKLILYQGASEDAGRQN